MRRTFLALFLTLLLGLVPGPGRAEDRVVKFKSDHDLAAFYRQLDYNHRTWADGRGGVPRLFLKKVPAAWGGKAGAEIDEKTKKRVFLLTMVPLALLAKEEILAEREKAQRLLKEDPASAELAKIAERYGLDPANVSSDGGKELLARLDIIPPSLVLAQMVDESGWGSSRFAVEGNALFGEWTWKKNGITPEHQRKNKGDYEVESFDSPYDSLLAYASDLNSDAAYEELRAKRAELRAAGERVTGKALVLTLVHYSERGEAYVRSLETIMRDNKLAPADLAALGGEPRYLLVPEE